LEKCRGDLNTPDVEEGQGYLNTPDVEEGQGIFKYPSWRSLGGFKYPRCIRRPGDI
jgi:hypothetical protein